MSGEHLIAANAEDRMFEASLLSEIGIIELRRSREFAKRLRLCASKRPAMDGWARVLRVA
jgi:hypothetical protein